MTANWQHGVSGRQYVLLAKDCKDKGCDGTWQGKAVDRAKQTAPNYCNGLAYFFFSGARRKRRAYNNNKKEKKEEVKWDFKYVHTTWRHFQNFLVWFLLVLEDFCFCFEQVSCFFLFFFWDMVVHLICEIYLFFEEKWCLDWRI